MYLQFICLSFPHFFFTFDAVSLPQGFQFGGFDPFGVTVHAIYQLLHRFLELAHLCAHHTMWCELCVDFQL
jgi:hypothetical protein